MAYVSAQNQRKGSALVVIMTNNFSIKNRLRSFGCAFYGAWVLIKTQPHAWVHAVATVLALGAACFFGLSAGEWALVCVAIGFVWSAEAFNTALEFLADEVSLEKRERIGYAKDVAAFGVLCAAITAVVIGGIIFVPKIIRYFVSA